MNAKEAAQRAAAYLAEFYPKAEGILLEEVEKESTENGAYWLITLSFALPTEGDNRLSHFFSRPKYKTLRVGDANGEVVSMKIRELVSAP